jgi:hypothetical protein
VAQQVPTRQSAPQKGLWTAAVGDAIGPEYTPWCQNVRFRYAKVLRAPGRSQTQDTSPGDPIMDFALQTNANGHKTIISLTNTQAAQFDPIGNNFSHKLGGLNITPNFDVRYSWTQGEEQLLIVRSSRITVINTMQANAAPGGGGGPAPPIDSSLFNIVRLESTPAGTFIEYFKNHVFLANISNTLDPSGLSPPQVANRLQWSAQGAYNDWSIQNPDGVGNYHGGFLDLYDGTVEAITGMKVLNDRLVVYRNSSIVDMNATGDPTNPFLPENRVFGIGCLLPWSLASLGQFHIFVGNDFNVYSWDGSNLDPIGSPIHSYIRQLFDPGQPFTQPTGMQWTSIPFAAVFMGFKEYWLAVPQATGTVVLIYDYFRSAWTRDFFPGSIHALMEAVLPGATQSSGFNPVGHPANYPTMLVSDATDFYEIDERIIGDWHSRPSDGGMDMFVDTPDMFYDQTAIRNATLERVLLSSDIPRETGEPPFDLYVSIDRGNSFPFVRTIQLLDEHWGWEFADLNITANVRRYRFFYPKENGAAVPTLRAYTDVYVPSGEFFPTIRPLNPPDPNIPPANTN